MTTKKKTGREEWIPFSEIREEWMKKPGFKEDYDAYVAECNVADTLMQVRANAKLSQVELAELMGTSQSTIARLESGRGNPSIATLERFAAATGTQMRLTFEPIRKRA